MSTRYSPFVKTDGLVFNFDAGNIKSLNPKGPLVETYPFTGDTLQRSINSATQTSTNGILTISDTNASSFSGRIQEDFLSYNGKILNVSFDYRSSNVGNIAMTGQLGSSQSDTMNNEFTWSTTVSGDNAWRSVNLMVRIVLSSPTYGGISFFGGISSYDIRNLVVREPQTNVVNLYNKNPNDGVVSSSNVYYQPASQSFYFNGEESGSSGIYIKNKSYNPSTGDSIEQMSIECWCKSFPFVTTTRTNDQRVIISFDRSSMFRFAIGDDTSSGKEGVPVFSFTDDLNNTLTPYAFGYGGDLRDNQWHQVGISFQSGVSEGLKFFIDGEVVYYHPTVFNPIGYISETEVPRFGWVGTGSESTSEGGTTGPDDLFFGYITSIKLYEGVALTDNEIKQNFNSLRGRFGI